MTFTKIILDNFQKHSHLEVDFTENVNIIHGDSASGKSCIRRAFEWVLRNQQIDSIRKEGTKQTTVTLVIDSGHEISRVRSNSINRYVLKLGEDVQQFDAIGRDVPQEILDVLKTEPMQFDGESIDLNIDKQISLPFLLDKSPSFRQKLFNKLTGNSQIDLLLKGYNKDCLSISKELKVRELDIEEQEIKVKELDIEVCLLRAKTKKAQAHLKELKTLENKYNDVTEIGKGFESLNKKIEEANMSSIKTLDIDEDIKNKIVSLSETNNLLKRSKEIEAELEACKTQIVKTISVDDKLLPNITKQKQINKLEEKLIINEKELYEVSAKISAKIEEEELAKEEYKDFLKENKTCPICSNELTEECLKGIKL